MESTYRVYTENDEEGRSTKTLGYAKGTEEDIRAYYDDKKYYDIHLDPISIVCIDKAAIESKVALLDEKGKLEARLKEIKQYLS